MLYILIVAVYIAGRGTAWLATSSGRIVSSQAGPSANRYAYLGVISALMMWSAGAPYRKESGYA